MIIVQFCNGLNGHISLLHSSDLPPKSLKEPSIIAKNAIGNEIKCGVLSCIAYKKTVNLTAKQSLCDITKIIIQLPYLL